MQPIQVLWWPFLGRVGKCLTRLTCTKAVCSKFLAKAGDNDSEEYLIWCKLETYSCTATYSGSLLAMDMEGTHNMCQMAINYNKNKARIHSRNMY